MNEQLIPIKAEHMKDVACKVIMASKPNFEVVVRPLKAARSLAQNRLYWKWLGEISKQYQVDGKSLTTSEWHHLCAMKFLGIKTIEIGEKTFPMPAKSTTKLKVSEFSEYLLKIETEFLPKGVALTFTDDYGTAMGKH